MELILSKILKQHVANLLECDKCPKMIGPVVSGPPILSRVLLIGQAPGPKEGDFGKPFAWTAGKTMFKWFSSCGMEEEDFRKKVYMAAVCRCFPGKNPKGGDRVPNLEEIENCSSWLAREMELLKPKLVIPVGKLAISQTMEVKKLKDIIGKSYEIELHGQPTEIIPLPHPSGASTWHRMEPGITLLGKALKLIKANSQWKALLKS